MPVVWLEVTFFQNLQYIWLETQKGQNLHYVILKQGSPWKLAPLTRMFHELLSRDREDGSATGQPQGVGPEAYLSLHFGLR